MLNVSQLLNGSSSSAVDIFSSPQDHSSSTGGTPSGSDGVRGSRSGSSSTGGARPDVRGSRGGAVEAAKIIGQQMAATSSEVATSITSLAKAFGAESSETSFQDKAMKFFGEGGLCSAYMIERDNRRKIFIYFKDAKNASSFLRTPDNFKGEYVEDIIFPSTV